MKKISFGKSEEGFTLLEVMVAMIIMSMSLLTLLSMSMVALDGNDWANKTTAATQAMQEKLENLRSNPGAMTSGSDTAAGMTRQWNVSSVSKFLTQVIVVTAWEDIKGNHKYDTLTAYIRADSV